MKTDKIIIYILGFFLLLGFSSCSSDRDYWIPSFIDSYGQGINKKDKNGYFIQATIPLDLNYDVYDYSYYSVRYIDQIQFLGGEIVIQSSVAYPSATVVAFDSKGRELAHIDLSWGGIDKNVYKGKEIQNFLYNISTYLNISGFVAIEVYVNDVQLIGNQQLKANIFMELNSLVR